MTVPTRVPNRYADKHDVPGPKRRVRPVVGASPGDFWQILSLVPMPGKPAPALSRWTLSITGLPFLSWKWSFLPEAVESFLADQGPISRILSGKRGVGKKLAAVLAERFGVERSVFS